MDSFPTRTQALRQEVSRMREEIADLRERNAALEKENTLLSLMGPAAVGLIQRPSGAKKRAWA